MNVLLMAPLVVPLATAAVCLASWRWRTAQRWFGIGGAVGLLAVGIALVAVVDGTGYQVVQAGNWPAPFGITLIADRLSAVMVLMAGVVGTAAAVAALDGIDSERVAYGFYPLLHTLLMGVCGAFLTGDLFNLYVWFEVTLMASFVLLVLGGEPAQLRGGITYVTLNLVSSAVFLAAIGILYGVAGTLNMADLARKLDAASNPGLVTTIGALFLVAFGVKAAVFPLFPWLPAAYPVPPAVVSAVFAGLLTKVGVYALIRGFALIFTQNPAFTHIVLAVAAGLTMLTGALGAIPQTDLRRALAFLHVGQLGYMMLGLGLAGLAGLAGPIAVAALAATVFTIVHHICAMTTLFLVAGVIHRLRGTYDLGRLGSLTREQPLVAGVFLLPALALSGVPPLSGFFAKLAILRTALGEPWAVAAILAAGFLTLYAVSRLWAEGFWKEAPEPAPRQERPWRSLAPAAMLSGATILLGLCAEPVIGYASRAADQLLDREGYIRAVLEESP